MSTSFMTIDIPIKEGMNYHVSIVPFKKGTPWPEVCKTHITSGFINPDLVINNPCFAKKQKFKFCPNCGKLNK